MTQAGIEELLGLLRNTGLVLDRIGVEGSGGLGRPVMLPQLTDADRSRSKVSASRCPLCSWRPRRAASKNLGVNR